MKVAFFSNFLNHHQAPFCEEMIKLLGSDFVFVSTEQMPDSFAKSGYPNLENIYYNLLSYTDSYSKQKALNIANTYDVVIIGSAPDYFIKERIRQNKLTFRYSERWHKKVSYKLLNPKRLFSIFMHHTRYRSKKLYMLCASAFTKQDVYKYFAYPDKCYKWGYFTKVENLDESKLIRNNAKVKLLWVGRFIDWKHPELAIYLASRLKNNNIDFELSMVGNGPMFNVIKGLITNLDLVLNVNISEALPNCVIRDMMLDSDIFLFTSDRNEGWGAVLSEAMSLGCVPVVSDEVGAAPFLVEHLKNGMIYKSNDLESLFVSTYELIKDKNLRTKLGFQAYHTMADIWSPANAASNLVSLASDLINNYADSFPVKGPCSKA